MTATRSNAAAADPSTGKPASPFAGWAPGQKLEVQLVSTDARTSKPFAGFMAVSLAGSNVTSWSRGSRSGALRAGGDANVRNMKDCEYGVTHPSADYKTTVTFVFEPPAAAGSGAVTIWAVFATDHRGDNYEVKLVIPESTDAPAVADGEGSGGSAAAVTEPTPVAVPEATPSKTADPAPSTTDSSNADVSGGDSAGSIAPSTTDAGSGSHAVEPPPKAAEVGSGASTATSPDAPGYVRGVDPKPEERGGSPNTSTDGGAAASADEGAIETMLPPADGTATATMRHNHEHQGKPPEEAVPEAAVDSKEGREEQSDGWIWHYHNGHWNATREGSEKHVGVDGCDCEEDIGGSYQWNSGASYHQQQASKDQRNGQQQKGGNGGGQWNGYWKWYNWFKNGMDHAVWRSTSHNGNNGQVIDHQRTRHLRAA